VRRNVSPKDTHNPNLKEITWKHYPEAASQSDFVICVLPLTPETEGLLLIIKKRKIPIKAARNWLGPKLHKFNLPCPIYFSLQY